MALLAYSSKAEATLACEPSLVFEILTDYDSWCEWVPAVNKSKLLAKEGDLALAEVEVTRPFADKLDFECIHDKNRSVLLRLISGEIPIAKVEWTIAAAGPKECRVTVVLEGKPNPHWLLPSYRKLLGAANYIGALKGQVAAYGTEVSVAGEGGEVILDLMDTPDGLVLVYRGQKYLLQPIPTR